MSVSRRRYWRKRIAHYCLLLFSGREKIIDRKQVGLS